MVLLLCGPLCFWFWGKLEAERSAIGLQLIANTGAFLASNFRPQRSPPLLGAKRKGSMPTLDESSREDAPQIGASRRASTGSMRDRTATGPCEIGSMPTPRESLREEAANIGSSHRAPTGSMLDRTGMCKIEHL